MKTTRPKIRPLVAGLLVTAIFTACVPPSTPMPNESPASPPTDTPQPRETPDPITAFAGPILLAIRDRPPDFQDDFSEPSTQWAFYSWPDSARGTIDFANGAVMMNVEAGQAAQSAGLELGGMLFANFVLKVDLDLRQLDSHKQAEIIWGSGYSFTLGPLDGWQLMYLGSAEPTYLSQGDAPVELSDPVTITIVAKGTEIAVYLNSSPLTYYNDAERPSTTRTTISLWVPPSTAESASIAYDNLSIWNLDSVFPPPTPTPNPLAAGFAGPILTAIQDQPPDFQDDFSEPSTQWAFYHEPEPARGTIGFANGAVTMNMEASQAGWNVALKHGGMHFANFVLRVDVHFQQPDTNQRAWISWGSGYTFSLSYIKGWQLTYEGLQGQILLCSGDAPFNLSEPVAITLVSKGTEIAVYLNGIPLAYCNDTERPWSVYLTIGLSPETDESASIAYDNLSIWNLDSVFPPPTPTPNPLAAGYAGPILTAIQDRPPDFQDDFSQDSGQWQYHVYPDEARGFFEIANGVLTMSVEPGQMGSIGNDGMLFDNFVLQVDAYFEPLPSNILSISWRGGLTHWHSIEVFSLGPERWMLLVCNDSCTEFTSGPLPVNLSLPVTITIVSRGTEIAVCLNSIPLTYYNDLGRTPGPSIGIMLLRVGEPGDSAIGLDNLKVWDLDKLE